MKKFSKKFIATVLTVMLVLCSFVVAFSENASADNSAVLVEVRVAESPDKTTYYVGERLNTAGMLLAEIFSDGTSQGVTSGYTCTPTVLENVGEQTITVSYSGFTATFTVNVIERPAETTTTRPAQTTAPTTRPVQTTAVARPTQAPVPTTRPVITTRPAQTTTVPAATVGNIGADSIQIKAADIEFRYGQEKVFKVDVACDDMRYFYVSWTSSNPSVATVNQDGRVTACGEGNAVITASLIDRNGRVAVNSYGEEVTDKVMIKCTMTFWDKIVRFFKNLFSVFIFFDVTEFATGKIG